MSYVVTVLSWTGWIWTAAFFAVVIPWLVLAARRGPQPASGGHGPAVEQDEHA